VPALLKSLCCFRSSLTSIMRKPKGSNLIIGYGNSLVPWCLSVRHEIRCASFQLSSPALKDRSTLILSLRDVHDRLPRQGLLRVARYFSAGSRAKRAVSLLFADRPSCNHYFVTDPKEVRGSSHPAVARSSVPVFFSRPVVPGPDHSVSRPCLMPSCLGG